MFVLSVVLLFIIVLRNIDGPERVTFRNRFSGKTSMKSLSVPRMSGFSCKLEQEIESSVLEAMLGKLKRIKQITRLVRE